MSPLSALSPKRFLPGRIGGLGAMLCALAVGLSAPAAQAAPPQVVADLPVPWSLTAQIMDGVGTPRLLVEPGTDPHDLQLRPSQVRLLTDAELVVWTGAELLPPVAEMLHRLEMEKAALALLEIPGPDAAGEHAEDEPEDAHKADAGDEAHHDDDALHAWLDPRRALAWVDPITERLAAMDPENAATYRANAVALAQRIGEAETQVEALVAPLRDRPVIVLHDAYAPFAERFKLEIVGAIAEAEGMPSSARRLVELRRLLVDTGARCAFHEPHQSDALLRNVGEGTGIRIGTLDASGGFGEQTPDLYPRLLVELAESLARCDAGTAPDGGAK